MKIAVMFLLVCRALWSDVLKVKDKFPYDSFTDQFDKKLAITPDTKEVIVSFSKKNGKTVKTFLESHEGYLNERQAVYLADVSSAPSIAMSLFMKPALRKHNFRVGLINDEKIAKTLPAVEGKTTVIKLEKLYIKSITFIDSL